MIAPSIGVAELLTIFAVVILWLAIPAGILYLLFSISKRLGNIEELLKKNKDD
jgi:uncharacterized membrane protein